MSAADRRCDSSQRHQIQEQTVDVLKVIPQVRASERIVAPHIQEHVFEVIKQIGQESADPHALAKGRSRLRVLVQPISGERWSRDDDGDPPDGVKTSLPVLVRTKLTRWLEFLLLASKQGQQRQKSRADDRWVQATKL